MGNSNSSDSGGDIPNTNIELTENARDNSSRTFTEIPILLQGNPLQTVPSSSVVTSYVLAEWQEIVLLFPHEFYRFYFGLMLKAMNNFNPDDEEQQWKISAFLRWYKEWFYPALLSHHNYEENILFAWIKEKVSDWPEQIEADHAELLKNMNTIKALGESQPSPEDGKQLKELVKELVRFASEHFAKEEEFFPKKLREANATYQEWVAKNIEEQTKKTLPGVIYVLHSWGGEKAVEKLRSELPGHILMMNDQFWDSPWRKSSLGGLQDIIAGNTQLDDQVSCLEACNPFTVYGEKPWLGSRTPVRGRA